MLRNVFLAGVVASSLLAVACGDGAGGAGGAGDSGGASADGGHGGAGGSEPVACGDTGGLSGNEAVRGMLGRRCTDDDETCTSDDGCSSCSVTCVDGIWQSTDEDVCLDSATVAC